MDKKELEKIIQKLHQGFIERLKLLGFENPAGILHPPARSKDIAAFERRMGWKFPPSYRLFLSLHNGWEGYGIFTLIGVSGDHTEKALSNISRAISTYKFIWEKKHGKATEENIKKFESLPVADAKTLEGARLYIANKPHFGIDSYASWRLFFNPNKSSPDGEMEVVSYDGTDGSIMRYSNFFEMLKSDLAVLKKHISDLKST